jgi:ribonuclease HI
MKMNSDKEMGRIGNSTNNVAEYMGLIEGFKQAILLDIKYIEIEGDSQLVSLAIL